MVSVRFPVMFLSGKWYFRDVWHPQTDCATFDDKIHMTYRGLYSFSYKSHFPISDTSLSCHIISSINTHLSRVYMDATSSFDELESQNQYLVYLETCSCSNKISIKHIAQWLCQIFFCSVLDSIKKFQARNIFDFWLDIFIDWLTDLQGIEHRTLALCYISFQYFILRLSLCP